MKKVFSLVAAAILGCALGGVARAGVEPLDLRLSPAEQAGLAPEGFEVPQALTLDLQAPARPALASAKQNPPELSLATNKVFVASSDFLVGRDTMLLFTAHGERFWRTLPPPELRPEWEFIRRQIAGPGNLERIGDMLDVDEQERPWATTTTVHLLAPGDEGRLLPFATIAHEVDADEDFERFGLGAGAQINLGKHTTLGAEVIYFGADHSGSNSGFARETQFLARLQIEF